LAIPGGVVRPIQSLLHLLVAAPIVALAIAGCAVGGDQQPTPIPTSVTVEKPTYKVSRGDVAPSSAGTSADVGHDQAVIEQRIVVVESIAATGQPSISEADAETAATRALATSSKPTSVDARYVVLTIRNEDGSVAWGFQSRPAWLVTFHGIGYPLAAASASDCSCSAYYWRPSTVVALDAATGTVLVRMGVTA